jgi:predicted transcriptional regulator
MARHNNGKSYFAIDGERLTAARISAGMSLQDVANRIKCNKSSVSRWEQGTLCPSDERIFILMEMFEGGDFLREGHAARLTWKEVDRIRELLEEKKPQDRIAKMFGLPLATISAIARNEIWKRDEVTAQ